MTKPFANHAMIRLSDAECQTSRVLYSTPTALHNTPSQVRCYSDTAMHAASLWTAKPTECTAMCSKAQHRQLTSTLHKHWRWQQVEPSTMVRWLARISPRLADPDPVIQWLAFRTDCRPISRSYHWDPLPLEHWRLLDISWCHVDMLILIATMNISSYMMLYDD